MDHTKTVLVLLNDLMFQVKIAEAAKRAGWRAVFVSSKQKLLQSTTEEAPALILIDVNCPTANSIDAIRQLKSTAQTSSIPLVGYVSHVQVELRQEAVNAGCNVVLARSVFVQKLDGLFLQEGEEHVALA